MTNQTPHLTVHAVPGAGSFLPFSRLLQKGIHLHAQVGTSIRHLLCGQCKISGDYLASMVQTIFLDGKVVDDVNTATVRGGSTVALSAAMPGLAGATLRTGGLLAAFRDGITHHEDVAPADGHGTGLVKLKLFNLLIAELGPGLLAAGVWVTREEVAALAAEWAGTPQLVIRYAVKDGRTFSPEQLSAVSWASEPDTLFVRVVF